MGWKYLRSKAGEGSRFRNTVFYKPDGKPVTLNKGRVYRLGRDIGWQSVKDYRNKDEIEKPLGQWNRMEIVAKDREIKIYLNGILVNNAVNVSPGNGSIQIQSEGAGIVFRKIDLEF